MTHAPHTIGQEQPVARAHEMMREYKIRHLPVLHGGKLVGIVSLGDLHLLETLEVIDTSKVTVEEAMTADVYTASPETKLAEVVEHMIEHKNGSAVIVDKHGKVSGVFTTIDALRVLIS